MAWRAEYERRSQRRVQARPEGAGEALVAVRDEHVGQPYVAEHRRDQLEVASVRLGGGGLEGRDQPHAPSQAFDVRLQKAVTGAGDGHWQIEEVVADTPAA